MTLSVSCWASELKELWKHRAGRLSGSQERTRSPALPRLNRWLLWQSQSTGFKSRNEERCV